MSVASPPEWAQWRRDESLAPFTVGVEEEVMLLSPRDWSLAHQIDRVLDALPAQLRDHVTAETHRSALELATGPHRTASEAARSLAGLRDSLDAELWLLGLRAAAAGTHPFATWEDSVVHSGDRQREVYGSMRELARREPTFALHVHVGVPDPDQAIALLDALRAHAPLLLALSANSPFWQGRDTGLASARTPLFQAFPRVGIPRRFGRYEAWVEAVDLLIRCRAIEEPTYLWWDVRPQPRLGTVELRIMDVQSSVAETQRLVALVQAIARLEVEEGYASPALVDAPEALEENRFLAARDGSSASLIDPVRERRVPVRRLVAELLERCRDHAADLGCASELEAVRESLGRCGADRQLELARRGGRLRGLVADLADEFAPAPPPQGPGSAASGPSVVPHEAL